MNRSFTLAYRAAEIETLSQRDLVVRLYQGAEKFLYVAQRAMEEHQYELAHLNCQKAKDIFIELMSTLNFEAGGDIANRLRDLYSFFLAQIAEANLRHRSSMLVDLMPVIATLRSAWEGITPELANGTVLAEEHGHSLFVRT